MFSSFSFASISEFLHFVIIILAVALNSDFSPKVWKKAAPYVIMASFQPVKTIGKEQSIMMIEYNQTAFVLQVLFSSIALT
jgi:hypothetical protein